MTEHNKHESQISEEGDSSSRSDSGYVWLVVLVVLAIGASVVMLFTDSDAALKIALLAALWAAIIGAFLVYRYRLQARQAQAQLDARAAEFDRAPLEDSSRLPALFDEDFKAEYNKNAEEGYQLLLELKEEISILRDRLEDLAGQPLFYEPEAIRAEARRVLEVEAKARSERFDWVRVEQPVEEPEVEDFAEDLKQMEASEDAAAAAALKSAVAEFEEPADTQVEDAQEPEVKRTVAGAPSAEAIAGRIGRSAPSGSWASEYNPLSSLISENQRSEEPEEQAPEPETGGGRRRRDEHERSVSVAELLKRAARDK